MKPLVTSLMASLETSLNASLKGSLKVLKAPPKASLVPWLGPLVGSPGSAHICVSVVLRPAASCCVLLRPAASCCDLKYDNKCM